MEPVFVDHTGRRRRLFTGVGAGVGVLLIIGCTLLIAGLTGSSPVPLPGLPERGQGGLRRGDAGASVEPSRSPAHVTRTATPSHGAAAAVRTSAVANPASSPDVPGNRKTSHPGNPGNSGNPGNAGNPKPSRAR